MSINTITNAQTSNVYAAYETPKTEQENAAKKPQETEQEAAVYEKSETKAQPKATYTINRMSEEDRAALVKQLKSEQESRYQSLQNLVATMMGKQAKTFSMAQDDSIWEFLASGDYTVTEAAKVQAQKDISEDGYWGVKQTSQRLFDFASALAGDDPDKMKQMQEAMQKGFGQAEKAWGRELPEISSQTLDAANRLFEAYYADRTTVSTAE